MEAATFWRIRPHEFMDKFLSAGIRPDGRKFSASRQCHLKRGAISTADGSCQLSLGNTTVLTGIKLEVGVPSESLSNGGVLDVSVILSPLCSSQFQLGRPTDFALATSEFITSTLVQSKLLDLSQLTIVPGKLCWILRISILCLNLDGNLTDASFLSLHGALQDLKLYTPIISEAGGDLVTIDKTQFTTLRLRGLLVPTTCLQYRELLFCDPTAREESLSDGSVTVVVNQEGTVCGLRKPGGRPISGSDLEACRALARKRFAELAILMSSE